MKDPEIIVIESGIGGLCCAGLLAKAGKKVLILEAHTKPGGAAHALKKNGFKFESGPSRWSGIGNCQQQILWVKYLKYLSKKLS